MSKTISHASLEAAFNEVWTPDQLPEEVGSVGLLDGGWVIARPSRFGLPCGFAHPGVEEFTDAPSAVAAIDCAVDRAASICYMASSWL